MTPALEHATDEDLEEVFGRPPQLTKKEHIWLGQTDDEGQPEVMDEAREEEVIKELRQLAVATGVHMNVSCLLPDLSFLGPIFNVFLVSCLGGLEDFQHEESIPPADYPPFKADRRACTGEERSRGPC